MKRKPPLLLMCYAIAGTLIACYGMFLVLRSLVQNPFWGSLGDISIMKAILQTIFVLLAYLIYSIPSILLFISVFGVWKVARWGWQWCIYAQLGLIIAVNAILYNSTTPTSRNLILFALGLGWSIFWLQYFPRQKIAALFHESQGEDPRVRELKFTLSRIFKNPAAIIGVSLMIVFYCMAIFAPYLAPPKDINRPYQMPLRGFSPTPKPPGEKNIFGTTSGQYDIYYGIIWGTRSAFQVGVFVVGLALMIGVTLGTTSGYFGGWIDEIIMRFVDIMYAIPMLVLAMAIVVAFGRGLDKIIWALALVQWRIYVRLLRAEILTLRERDFILAAKTMGVSNLVIMLKHILPNAIYPVLIVASLNVGSVVIAAAFMSFIGLGAPKGYADWGQMVALARNYIIGPQNDPFRYWYTVVIPGVAIVLFVLAWNLLGDALRDAFDPKQRRR